MPDKKALGKNVERSRREREVRIKKKNRRRRS